MRGSSAVALVLVLGCRPPEETPVEPSITPVVLPTLDEGCGDQTPGWLSAERGQLVFWPSETPWGGPHSDGDVLRTYDGEQYRPRWTPRAVLLRRGTDEWFSTLLPGTGPDSVIAVRTIYGEEHVDGRDELVEITPGTMKTQVLWAPGRRLLLLGRTGRGVIVLGYDGKVARVVRFDLDTRAIVESVPIDLDLDALTIRADTLHRSWRLDPVDGGNEWSTCRGPNEYVLECRGRLCRARLDGERLEIADVSLEPCPEIDAYEYLPEELGPPVERWRVSRGLPVDGRIIYGVPVNIDACAVRTNLEFPPIDPEQPCHVELVDRGGPDSMPWFHELHVGPGCTISTGFSEYAFALPPELIEIEPLPDRGRWRVRLPFPDSAFSDGDCLQGQLWLRRLDWAIAAREETWLEWDYGFCE